MASEKEKLDLYREIFVHSTDGIAVITSDNRFEYVNPRFTEIFGYVLKDIPDRKTWFEKGYPDIAYRGKVTARWSTDVAENNASGEAQPRTYTVRCLDGQEKTVRFRIAALQDGKQFLSCDDLTDREKAEDALRISEEKYRTVLHASPDPVVIYDMNGNAAYINPAFTQVFGWETDELLGDRIDFVPDENWPETKDMIDKVLAGVSFSGHETRRYTKNGRLIDVSISAAVYKDRKGKSQGSIINLRDITEKKELEAQLFQAHKMEAVGTLAGGIAHDFNNILQAISGYTQILMMDAKTDSPDFNTLRAIEKAAQRASELVRRLLIFGRKVNSKLRPVDLNHEVTQVSRMLERTIPKMIGIELRLADNLRLINADPVQLEQILMNMGVNARDAMAGSGKLCFETRSILLDREACKTHLLSKPGEYLLLRISDTGHGMDKDTRDRIFEPFFTTKQTGQGTGLGLSMVYGIVKNHGGEIACTSAPEQGTIFDIYFPVLALEKTETVVGWESKELAPGKESILLVDDEKFILDIGKNILERVGYRVLTAESGEQGLERYRDPENSIDLVILDINMPGMGGNRCMKALLEKDPAAKIIIASGYASKGYEKEAIATGAAGFIGKPYKLSEMMSKVRDVLDRN